jgi:uncharacterized protein YcfJ
VRIALVMLAAALPAAAQITFYERESFQGRSLTLQKELADLERAPAFNASATSVIVARGRWEVCDIPRFEGLCRVLRPGRYPTLSAMGLAGGISSTRMIPLGANVPDERIAPAAWQVADYQQRNKELLYDAEVTSVRVVVGAPGLRCWVEHGPATGAEGNIVGGMRGAVLGGILGHQLRKDARDEIGMNVARDLDGQPAYTRNLQKCDKPSVAEPEYWDVGYSFRGREHQVQTASRPRTTVRVNANGEPRVGSSALLPQSLVTPAPFARR